MIPWALLFEHLISPQNGYGFKTNGGSQYVDLGDWTNETCFVDIERCEQGNSQLQKASFIFFLRFTMLTNVNITPASCFLCKIHTTCPRGHKHIEFTLLTTVNISFISCSICRIHTADLC